MTGLAGKPCVACGKPVGPRALFSYGAFAFVHKLKRGPIHERCSNRVRDKFNQRLPKAKP